MDNEKLKDFVNTNITYISTVLPNLVKENPSSFECGHKLGYKQALLDVQKFMGFEYELREQ